MSIIIGISAHYHDAACCLIKDGILIAAAQEERFTKIKHDPSIPTHAFRYCLKEARATIKDVSCIAYYEDPISKVARQLWAGLPDILTEAQYRFRVAPARPETDIRESLGYYGEIEFVAHHLSHAASAFFFSGFKEAAIFTVDGVGEWATTTYGKGIENTIELFEEVTFPHSLGLLYSAITAYLGFDINDAEYKVMGLAPYGNPHFVNQMWKLIELENSGQYRLNMDYFDFLTGEHMYSNLLCELFGQPARIEESEILQFHKDVAASLQIVLEETLLQKVKYLHGKYPSNNLCMAGGVALNCVANGRIHREGPFSDLFIQPAASDAGSALGAAAIAYIRQTGSRPSMKRLQHVYLGSSYSNREIAQLIKYSDLNKQASDFSDNEAGLIHATAKRLADGKVVGWFQGRMEFGPRALGARSILADPRQPQMRDRINKLVKMRETFRPFAPAVLASKMSEHFDLTYQSPFMLETCRVISPLSLPAITHVDGSARVQTVTKSSNQRFCALLVEFDRITKCPVILNTSFNLRGEPIVLDPVDAVWTFMISKMDTLVIENFIIDRGENSAALNHVIDMLRTRKKKRTIVIDSLNVYTFL